MAKETVWELVCQDCGHKVHASNKSYLSYQADDHRRVSRKCSRAKFTEKEVYALTGEAVNDE